MKYCENCGRQCGDDERFCRACGRPLSDTAAASGNINESDLFAGQRADGAGNKGQSGFGQPSACGGSVGTASFDGDNTVGADRPTDDNRPDSRPSEQPFNGRRPDDLGQCGGQPFGGMPVNGQPVNSQPINSQPINSQPVNGRPADPPFNTQQYNPPPYGNVPPGVPPYNNVPPYYGQSGGYYASNPYISPQNPNKGIATASLVLGILSLVFSVPVIGFILSIIGLILGVKAMKGYQKGEPGRGVAVAGFVCSVIGLAFAVLIILAVFDLAVLTSSYS